MSDNPLVPEADADANATVATEALLPEGPATLDWLRAAESLFDLLPGIFFFAKDCSGRFIAVNREFVNDRVGQSGKEEILGCTDFDFWPDHISEKYVQCDQQVMASGKILANVVELAIMPDHSTEWHSTTKIPLYDRLNRVVGTVGYCRDLTKQPQQGPIFQMGDVFDHVMRNFQSAIVIEDLASLMHLSISQFERQFKGLFGITPMHYLSCVRIDAACRYLAEGMEHVSEVARQCGFYDSSHFSRNFRKIMGLSPGEFRRRYVGTSHYPRVPSLTIKSASSQNA